MSGNQLSGAGSTPVAIGGNTGTTGTLSATVTNNIVDTLSSAQNQAYSTSYDLQFGLTAGSTGRQLPRHVWQLRCRRPVPQEDRDLDGAEEAEPQDAGYAGPALDDTAMQAYLAPSRSA